MNYFDNIKGTIKHFAKGEAIANQGDECKHLYYIIEGNVSITTFTNEDTIYTIKILSEGDFFGSNILFANTNLFLGNVTASKKTTIKQITKTSLIDALSNKEFLEYFLNRLSNEYLQLQNRFKILSQKTIRDKILFYLNLKSNSLNTNIIPLTSKENLAQLLNIPRPSLSRELINLKNDNLIDYTRNYILLKKRQ